jgi:hypothetical protein
MYVAAVVVAVVVVFVAATAAAGREYQVKFKINIFIL